LIEFKKFKYLESKKEKQGKKNAKENDLKEIRFGPFTGDHDLEVRVKQAQKFLLRGNKVKGVVKFVGRELGKKEFGYQILNKFIAGLNDNCKIDRPPAFEGRLLTTILSPVK